MGTLSSIFKNTYGTLVVIASISAILLISTIAFGATGGSMSGYAWSDNVGWISMDGPGYGLVVAPDGTISGYAWSDNIGWISAQSSDLVGCPTQPCTAVLSGSKLAGWFKALAADTRQSGGWDGWISLSGINYGPVLSGSSFSGFTWGSMNVGWVDMSLVTFQDSTQCTKQPYCDATTSTQQNVDASTCTYVSGGACTPDITCTKTPFCDPTTRVQQNVDAATCSFVSGGACTPSTCSKYQYCDDATQTQYNVTADCQYVAGGACDIPSTCYKAPYCDDATRTQYNVTVGCQYVTGGACVSACPNVCSGSNLVNSCDGTIVSSCAYGCAAGGCLAVAGPVITTWSVVPLLVREGSNVEVKWAAENAASCSVSGTNGDGTGSNATGTWNTTSGDMTTSPITSQTIYTITCLGLPHSIPSSVTQSSIVNILPLFRER